MSSAPMQRMSTASRLRLAQSIKRSNERSREQSTRDSIVEVDDEGGEFDRASSATDRGSCVSRGSVRPSTISSRRRERSSANSRAAAPAVDEEAEQHEGDDEDELVRKRRASKVLRGGIDILRGQMGTFKSTLKGVVNTILYIVILRGILDMAWHVQFAHITVEHTQRDDAYFLLMGPGLWYVLVVLACSTLICYVRSLSDDALLHWLRVLLGLEAPEGEEDVFESFKDVKDRLQNGLEGYERMASQINFATGSMSKISDGMRRLADNILKNHSADLEEPEEREGVISGLADVFFEFFRQLRTEEEVVEEVKARARGDDVNWEGSYEEARKAFMVAEVAELVRELKYWSEEERKAAESGEAAPTGQSSGRPAAASIDQVALRTPMPAARRSRADPSVSGGSISSSEATTTARSAPASERPLPEGWRVNYDETGRAYYYHRLTRKSQWHRPADHTPHHPPPTPPPSPPPPLPRRTPYIEEFDLDSIV